MPIKTLSFSSNTTTHLGTHIIAELSGCTKLDDLNFIRRAMRKAAKACGASVLQSKFHKFSPQGVTGYLLLAESHMSIHTWPEYGYAAVDVFTCGLMNSPAGVASLVRDLEAREVTTKTFRRGQRSPVD